MKTYVTTKEPNIDSMSYVNSNKISVDQNYSTHFYEHAFLKMLF